MAKVHLTTLGCPKNVVDSRRLEQAFSAEGILSVDDPRDADILLVNTCGFIREAKEESIGEILGLASLKADAGAQGKRLVVFGCLAQRYREELRREIPEIDEIRGVGQEPEIVAYCRSVAGVSQAGETKAPDYRPPASSYAYLKIAEGCDKRCTFCVIPSIRGRFRSIPPETILGEARDLLRSGARELVLVAQDITSYGRELGGYTLPALLKDLTSLTGDFWVRLMYLYPTSLDDALLELIAADNKIVTYLDIPLQHSEDRILRLMGRRGTRKDYVKLLRTVRRLMPGVAVRTSLITGFPSETEEEFNSLVDFVEEIRFDRLGVFTYSKEEGTPAWSLKGQVPEKVKERRRHEIMTRQSSISLEKNRDLIGRRFRALVDEAEGDVLLARLETHAPEIDGMVIIERSGPARGEREEEPTTAHRGPKAASRIEEDVLPRVGDFVTVEITDAYDYDLKGRIVHE